MSNIRLSPPVDARDELPFLLTTPVQKKSDTEDCREGAKGGRAREGALPSPGGTDFPRIATACAW